MFIVIDNILEKIIMPLLLRPYSCANDKSSIKNQMEKLLKNSPEMDTPITDVCICLICEFKCGGNTNDVLQT
jgi:hypothetical protein